MSGDLAGLRPMPNETLHRWRDRAETWRIEQAIGESGGNISAAARALGMARRTLMYRMVRLGIPGATERGGETARHASSGSGAPANDAHAAKEATA